jgi:hypothetical protein
MKSVGEKQVKRVESVSDAYFEDKGTTLRRRQNGGKQFSAGA